MISIDKKTLIKHFSRKAKPRANQAVSTDEKNLKTASVLIPILDDKELLVLFTERTSHLKHHAGQISFPGGKMETRDKNLIQTALRETKEEIGLNQQQIKILGKLKPVISSTGFLVTPFVGLVDPPLQLTLDPFEVAAVFTAPLNFILDPHNQHKEIMQYNGKPREIYVINYKNYRIWGMTAKILVEMTNVFFKSNI